MFFISARLEATLEPDDLLARLGLEAGGPVQRAIDWAVIRECRPYVPASPDRTLEFSPEVSSELGSGRVIWNTPYARYQYYGRVMTDERRRTWVGRGEQKPIVTDRLLEYDKAQNPLAGSYWFERMKADHLDDILAEARSALRRR